MSDTRRVVDTSVQLGRLAIPDETANFQVNLSQEWDVMQIALLGGLLLVAVAAIYAST